MINEDADSCWELWNTSFTLSVVLSRVGNLGQSTSNSKKLLKQKNAQNILLLHVASSV